MEIPENTDARLEEYCIFSTVFRNININVQSIRRSGFLPIPSRHSAVMSEALAMNSFPFII